MKIKYELLNFLTGLLLIIAGLIELFNRQFASAMSWIIFGSMYLVMDDYIPKTDLQGLTAKTLDLGRKIFSWVGLFCSLLLVLYYFSV